MTTGIPKGVCPIIPPYLLREIVRCGTNAEKECALETIIQEDNV